MIKECIICHEPFETNRSYQKVCGKAECFRRHSNDCAKKSYRINHGVSNLIKECPICHEKFEARHGNQVFCSKESCQRIRRRGGTKLIKECPICHELFEAEHGLQRYCSKEECRKARNREHDRRSRERTKPKRRRTKPKQIKECPVCHEMFEAEHGNQIFCPKEECQQIRRHRSYHKHYISKPKPEPQVEEFELSTCDVCGKKFKPHFRNEHYCCDECRYNSPLYLHFFGVDLGF